jgi:hypothetical protein
MSYIGNEPIVSATRTVTEITATAGQTVFTANGGYTVGYLDVFLNGAQLQNTDFTATNGSSVTLSSAAQAGDDIRLVAWGTFSSANLNGGNLLDGTVTQSKLATGVAGNGPVFSAYPSSNTTISSSTFTVLAIDFKEYDTASCYNNTGSTVNGIPPYSFRPNVAGYYLFSMVVNTELSASPTRTIAIIAKNGAVNRVSENQTAANGVFGGSILYYMNGTTDYVNAVIWLGATTPRFSGGLEATRFSGLLVRAA